MDCVLLDAAAGAGGEGGALAVSLQEWCVNMRSGNESSLAGVLGRAWTDSGGVGMVAPGLGLGLGTVSVYYGFARKDLAWEYPGLCECFILLIYCDSFLLLYWCHNQPVPFSSSGDKVCHGAHGLERRELHVCGP